MSALCERIEEIAVGCIQEKKERMKNRNQNIGLAKSDMEFARPKKEVAHK